MGNKDDCNNECAVDEQFGQQEEPKYVEQREAEKRADKTAADERKDKRIGTIKSILRGCFILFAVYLILIFLDLIIFKQNIADNSSMIVFITVISSTITASLAAVIGSSID